MPALWIAHVDVTDEETYGEYIKIASVVVPEHGGVFIARGGRFIQFEGKERRRNVVAVVRTNDRYEIRFVTKQLVIYMQVTVIH